MSHELSLPGALEALLSGQPRRQAEAVDQLLALAEEPERREALLEQMAPLATHADAQVRGAAYLVLAAGRGAGALPVLEANAQDPSAEARSDLAVSAANIGEPARALLARLLADPVIEVRFAAAAGLAAFADAAGLPVLAEALEVRGLRYPALSAMQALRDPRAAEPARRLFKKRFGVQPEERAAAAGVLVVLGDAEARAWLLERVDKRRGDDRGLAVELAGETGLREAVPSLRRMLADRGELFRGAAARALGRLADAESLEAFARLLGDESEDPELRMDAAEALMLFGSDSARRALEQAAAAIANPEVAHAVREALEAAEPA